MLSELEPHDVFISYAREDSDWVRKHLYEPLSACRNRAGRPARIFFDVGEHGIQIGQDFQTAIDQAIERTHKFLPVYSRFYFHKEMCLLELKMARQRDVAFSNQLLLPVLKDLEAAHEVPFGFKTLNWQSISDPNWFSKICQSLGLTYSSDRVKLSFLNQPGDVFASHTLPRIRVRLSCVHQQIQFEEQVAIRAEHGSLLGTTTQKTVDGVATFDDLSISEPTGATRLIAWIPSSSESIESDPFSVVARTGVPHPKPELPSVPAEIQGAEPEEIVITGRKENPPAIQPDHQEEDGVVNLPVGGIPIFFADGRHLIVLDDQRVTIYSADGLNRWQHPRSVERPLRLTRRNEDQILLADWSGNLQILRRNGTALNLSFVDSGKQFLVPADADIVGQDIYVGFWDGSLYRVTVGGERELLWRDPAGIQVLGAYGDLVFTCNFSGNLQIYRNRKLVGNVAIEPMIWSLKDTQDNLIAVGNKQFYHIRPDGSKVLGFDMPIGNIESVYELSALPVVMDKTGKGIRFNADLVITSTILTQPGACPVSADDVGKLNVFRNPDGTHTLQHQSRIIFSTSGGALAVNPQGDLFALAEEDRIRLFSETEFMKLVDSQSA